MNLHSLLCSTGANQRAAIDTLPEAAGGLYGASDALMLSRLAAQLSTPVLHIAEDQQSADRLEAEARFFADAALPILHFPDWETLAYDNFSPHQDIISQRLRVLGRLPQLKRGLLIVAAPCLLHRLPPTDYVAAHSLRLAQGQSLDLDLFVGGLAESGYLRVPQVGAHGEFAVRGSLIDLFPMGSEAPLRIDLFDNEIESIRFFDPDSQLSQDKIDHVDILPAREVPLDPDAIKAFRQRFRERFAGESQQSEVYRDVSNGIAHGGIEYYLSLFFDRTAALLDYLPATTLITHTPDIDELLDYAFEEARSRFEVLSSVGDRPLIPPNEAFITPDAWRTRQQSHPRMALSREKRTDQLQPLSQPLPPLALDASRENAAHAFSDFLNQRRAQRTVLVAETAGRREALLELCQAHQFVPTRIDSWSHALAGSERLSIVIGPIASGMLLDDGKLALVPEQAVFGQRLKRRQRRRRKAGDPENVIRALSDLSIGAPVVHEAYGVGRYRGLQTLDAGGVTSEFLTLEYAGGDKLYVPVHSLQLISRYTGASADKAPLHKLGSDQWSKARRKAAEKARDVAAELLDVYARRAARQGVSQPVPALEYRQFEAEFPFELTEDQATVIDEVLDDLREGTPMDRVVCGDVGFGKTEIALRAAFAAVQNHRQVLVLVPTTLLAQQHFQTFQDRFANWPVRIEQLSRFRSKKNVDATLEGLRSGSVDIVIGTHKLLSHTKDFKAPGLVIIDEEHRFGVRHKEALKSLRSEIDVLTLTATPIPRTLNMALGGLRELSLITTPPADRLSVKTFVTRWNEGLIREACLREIRRGGQVYFVHNRVEDIERIAHELGELVPEATIGIGHGQMSERELEQVMFDFYHRKFNLFVCTTIIESGIDVPSANTILINRADRFGLAQLHQMRGRVGRSHHRAYAYLLTPGRKSMTADAIKRLEAIESLEDLGAGFALASHDLEIRGAGELLGEGQSGQIQEIGFSMYTELLTDAVKSLRAGQEPSLDKPLNAGVEINLHVPALLPEDYVSDVHLRLMTYKRLASCEDDDGLKDMQVELIDRFGLLPPQTKMLIRITALKMAAERLGINKIDASDAGGYLRFDSDTPVQPLSLIKLVQGQPDRYSLSGSDRLRFKRDMPDGDSRADVVERLLRHLAKGIVAAQSTTS
ncbi:MAG: transcription-repair coupling factor [Pseudomonadota bacterium]